MKNRFTRLPLVLLLAIMAFISIGCTPLPILPIVEYPHASGPSATVAVLRNKQICGSYPPYYVEIDGRPIAMLSVGQHTSFQLTPGRHTLGVTYFIKDSHLVSYGLGFDRIANIDAHDFVADKQYYYVLTATCFPLDENKRVNIEEVGHWPEGLTIDPKDFVQVGPRRTTIPER